MKLFGRLSTPMKNNMFKCKVVDHMHMPATKLEMKGMDQINHVLMEKRVAVNAPVSEISKL